MTPAKLNRHPNRSSLAALAVLVTTLIVADIFLPARGVSGQAVRQPVQDIDRLVRDYDRLTLSPRDLLKAARQSGRVMLSTSRGRFDLEVEPFDILSPNYRAVTVGADGISQELPRMPSRSFRGKVAGKPDTYVRLVLDDGEFEGIIITPTETFFVEPRSNFDGAASEKDFVFYAQSSLIEPDAGECGTTLAQEVQYRAFTEKSGTSSATETSSPDPLFLPKARADVATESDFEFTSSFASAAAANADIADVMTLVDGIYDSQLGIEIKIVFQRTFAADNDPYTLTAASAALSQFAEEYDDSFAPGSPPARDLTHMFTGKNLDGDTIGIAYRGTLCILPEAAYGISQSKFSSNMTLRVAVTAHEIGHNFGASHPDQETPVPGGCSGTLMNSSALATNQFCQFSLDQITNHATGSGGSCLARSAAAGCTYSLSGTSQSLPTAGGNGSVALTTGGGCNWAVAEGSSWVNATPTSGTGSGTVNYSATANTGGPRRAFLDIGGQRFSVLQAASSNCAVTPLISGSPVAGSLASSDCTAGQPDREAAYVDIYSFNGMSGQQIRLEMSRSGSPLVDTYLYLLAPDGSLVTENDDIVLGVNTDSRIPVAAGTFFTLPQTGTYLVLATSFSNAEIGSYSLTLTSPPLVLAEQISGGVSALNSVTFQRTSNSNNTAFRIFDPFNFSSDQITRLILFTSDLSLASQLNPDPSVLSVSAGGNALVVENVGPASFPGLNGSFIVVALKRRDAGAMPTGNLAFTVTCRGQTSNAAAITIAP